MSKSSLSDREILLRISDRVDDLNEKLHELEMERVKTVADLQNVLDKQEDNLRIHLKRTELAEANLALLNDEVKPILHGMQFLKTLTKVASFIAGAVGAYFKFRR